MANVSRPSGFIPLRYRNGADWNGEANTYAFSASNAVAAYKYDLVNFDATNRIDTLVSTFMPGLPYVAAVASAITTAAQRGVVVGFYPEPEVNNTNTASLGLMYRLPSTSRWAMVADDPNVIFSAQESAGSYVSASNNMIGRVVGTSYTAGSTITGVSRSTLNSADSVTNATRPWKVVRFVPSVDNFNFVAGENPTNARYEILPFNWDLSLSYAATTSGSATMVSGA